MRESTARPVFERIESIANSQIIPNYFEVFDTTTSDGDAETALRNRIERDDRYLLVCDEDKQVRTVESTEFLYQTTEVLGFAFFGKYSAEEMDQYTAVPISDVYDTDDFPAINLRNLTIRESSQGTSVTVRLTRRLGEIIHGLEADVFVSFVRISDRSNVASFLESRGATRVAEYEDYPVTWDCPFCEETCECLYAFYRQRQS